LSLLGKKANLFDDETKAKHQNDLIKKLLKNNNTKISETMCTKFGIPIDDFPQIVNEKKRNSIRFYLSSYLKKK